MEQPAGRRGRGDQEGRGRGRAHPRRPTILNESYINWSCHQSWLQSERGRSTCADKSLTPDGGTHYWTVYRKKAGTVTGGSAWQTRVQHFIACKMYITLNTHLIIYLFTELKEDHLGVEGSLFLPLSRRLHWSIWCRPTMPSVWGKWWTPSLWSMTCLLTFRTVSISTLDWSLRKNSMSMKQIYKVPIYRLTG